MQHLSKNTQQLFRTVTKETLNAAHKVTIFVANALTDLASDSPPLVAPKLTNATRPSTTSRRPLPTAETRPSSKRRREAAMAHQPSGVLEGLQRAFQSVAREVGSAAETVIAVPIRQYEQTGPGGYVRSVIRALPIAIIRPIAGVAEGISYTMLGLRNDLDPAARYDDEDIWNIEPTDSR
jgi:autophagy-related protein 2